MNNLNSVLLEGDLVAAPALRHSPDGEPVTTLMVRSMRAYRSRTTGERIEHATTIEVRTTGKLATVCDEHLAQGRGIRVVGYLSQVTEIDAEVPRSSIVIVAEQVEFQPRRKRHEAAA